MNKTTRGIRNNNPLNIRKGRSRWRGEIPYGFPCLEGENADRAFCQFIGMEWGFRAAFVLMQNYISRYGCNTIEKIVGRWAPKADGNNTDKYINDVCRLSDIAGRAPLAATDPRLRDIVWAMAQIESGSGILAYREALERGWQLTKDNSNLRCASNDR